MSKETSSHYEDSISSEESPTFRVHSASVENFVLKGSPSEKVKKSGDSEMKRSKSFSFWNKSFRKKKMGKVTAQTEIGESRDGFNLSGDLHLPKVEELDNLNQNQRCIVNDQNLLPDSSQSVNCLDSGEIEIQRFSTVKRNKKDLKGIERINAISPLTGATILLPLGTPGTPFYSENSPSPLVNSLENVERIYNAYFFEPEKEKATPEAQNNRNNTETDKNEKINSKKKFTLVTLLLVLSLLIVVGSLVTAVVILSQGTESTVKAYFRNANPHERYSVLSNLLKTYNFQLYEGAERDEKQISSDLLYKKSKMAEGGKLNGFNSFEGIPEKYKADLEIRDLMVNEAFPVGRSVFYGLAYSPRGAVEPQCQVSKREILLDMAVLSKVTCRIRNYGMQCKQSEYILDAIQELNLNMTLSVGVWIGENEKVNQNQMSELKRILKKYPMHLFEAIYVGNEVLFRQEQTTEKLVEYIQEARNFAISLGYTELSVGTSEIGSLISKELIENTDVIGVNIHPFFGGVRSEEGSRWTFDFLDNQILPIVNGKSEIVITEVGWPYAGGKYKSAVASPSDFLQFLHEFVCQAYKNSYGWYYFEAFDEPWKEVFYEGENKWETEWGVFTNDRKLKGSIEFNDMNC